MLAASFGGVPFLEEHVFSREIAAVIGETCFRTAILSFILERHTMKDYYRNVRDDSLLNDPSFVERYSEREGDDLIEVAFRRKLRLNLIWGFHTNDGSTCVKRMLRMRAGWLTVLRTLSPEKERPDLLPNSF